MGEVAAYAWHYQLGFGESAVLEGDPDISKAFPVLPGLF